MLDRVIAFVVTYWPGILVGGFVFYSLAKITSTSPVWAALGKIAIRRIEAFGSMTKNEVRTTAEGASATVNAFLDKIDPKETKRVPVVKRILGVIAERDPTTKTVLKVGRGAVKVIRWLRNRRKR